MVAGPASRERPTERRRDSTERRHTKTPQAPACGVLNADTNTVERLTWASRSRSCPTIKWRVPSSRLTEIIHARFGGVPRSVSVPLLVPRRTNLLPDEHDQLI